MRTIVYWSDFPVDGPDTILCVEIQKFALVLGESVTRVAELTAHTLGLSAPFPFALALPPNTFRCRVGMSKSVE